MSPRRRRDPEATRQAILDAAQHLFLERGPGDVPTSEVADRAGVTKSLIHHHFGSKDDLWEAVKKRHFQKYFDAQKEMLASAPGGTLDLLRDSMIAYFRFLQEHPESVRFMVWRAAEPGVRCLGAEEELYELGIERVREAQEAGEIRSDIEPVHAIKAFLGLVLSWFETRDLFCGLLDGEFQGPEMDERYLRDIVGILVDGVRARPESR